MPITRDHLLGQQVSLLQPSTGFRASIDGVFLAAFVKANPEDRILDVGCGVGTILLCLGKRIPDLKLFGVEQDPEIAN